MRSYRLSVESPAPPEEGSPAAVTIVPDDWSMRWVNIIGRYDWSV